MRKILTIVFIFLWGLAASRTDTWGAPGDISTVAGSGPSNTVQGAYSGDNGPALNARFDKPTGVAVDANGNIYILDMWNFRVRRIDALTQTVTTVVGTGVPGFSGDNGPATNARIGLCTGISVDSQGHIFLAETDNERIRRVDAVTGIITTVAGNGNQGYSGDNGPATRARLNRPYAAQVDAGGHLYICDTWNHRVRRVDSRTGLITTVAGNGVAGFSGDGGIATNASLTFPTEVIVDGSGHLYVVDNGNNRIRRIDALTQRITTVAGNGMPGFSGDGGLAVNASINYPYKMSQDRSGNIFFSDSANERIRRIDSLTGIISTVVGTGTAGFSGDGGPAISAQMSNPHGVFVDAVSNLFIADSLNHRIRRVELLGRPTPQAIIPNTGSIAGGTPITITGSHFSAGATVRIGGVNASNVVFVNSTHLTAVTPAATVGPKDVVVTNPDGQSETLPSAFTYETEPSQATLLQSINLFDPNRGETGEIGYQLDQAEHVTIRILDRLGFDIVTLVDEQRGAGVYVDRWNGRNQSGDIVASGYYHVLLQAGGRKMNLKLVVLK